jgi:hypothetical protein
MKINIIDYPTDDDWTRVRNNALFTQRKDSVHPPTSELRTKFLVSEHSPIYTLHWTIEILDIPSWTSNQFVRSHEGFVPFVSTQRNDKQNEYDRRKAPQDAPVNLRFEANAEGILLMSRKRLCFTASNETRIIWENVIEELKKVSPELAELCVKPCIYRRGICAEVFSTCRYNQSPNFVSELAKYEKYFKLP